MGSTAIISDLHLGGLSGEALLIHDQIREILLEELRGADRVVLLGDAVEMRDLPLREALSAARPFLEELGDALRGAEVILVPGNHDHHLATSALEETAFLGAGSLGLERLRPPEAADTRQIQTWLGSTPLTIAYPGVWLREDTYAMHGHQMDLHLTLPRAECVAAAAVARLAGPPPDPAEPGDYERLLGPANGLMHGLAQSGAWRHVGGAARPSERAWTYVSGRPEGPLHRRLAGRVARRAGLPLATAALNRLLRSEFEAELSGAAIKRGGIAAATELARRLRIDARHVIMGHTHHAGPSEDASWPLAGGGELHNTGNWIFARALHSGSTSRGPFWPGTVTWLQETGPPRRVSLLEGLRPTDLSALVKRSRAA